MKELLQKILDFVTSLMKSLPKDSSVTPISSPSDISAWFTVAKKEVGEHEILGSKDNARIMEYGTSTTYKETHDEVPWCANFVGWCLMVTGYKNTKSAAAISYENYGTACSLKPGCIVVFKWASGDHHVTFCDHIIDASAVACLGGNQGNAVKVSNYLRKYIVATRWPVKA